MTQQSVTATKVNDHWPCGSCGVTIHRVENRVDRLYCSGACRQRAYRRRMQR